MTRTFLAASAATLTACACIATAPQAFAETAQVRIADLDLSSSEGQAKLQVRISAATGAVCSFYATGSRIRSVDAECITRARASIERQLAARHTSPANGG